jgi:hypothetical protein
MDLEIPLSGLLGLIFARIGVNAFITQNATVSVPLAGFFF